ncbi:MAG: hypothetical protein ACYDCK_07360 [Thermoplasmatota archaeon]
MAKRDEVERARARAARKESLGLVLKTILILVGTVLFLAGGADFGASFGEHRAPWRGLALLVVGLSMVVTPLALAFREALAAKRRADQED